MSTIVFTWTIDNFLDLPDNSIFSPHFTIHHYTHINWRLNVYPKGKGNENAGFVSIFLHKPTKEFEAEIEFELTIVGSNNTDKVNSKVWKHFFDSQDTASLGWLRFVPRSQLVNDLLVDGSLTFQIKKVRVFQVVELKERLDATVFNWDIDDFASRSQNQLTSEKFTIPGHPMIRWQLICFRNGDFLSVQLKIDLANCEIEMHYQLKVVHSDKKFFKLTVKSDFNQKNNNFVAEQFVRRSKLIDDGYLVDGTLKIQVKVFHILRIDYLNDYLNRLLKREPLDLDSLFDFRLKAGDKTFKVHKYVLAKESPYFKTMLDNDFKEKQKNRVDLSQFKSEVIQEVLRFVYTGQLQNFDQLSDQLIIAADYFQMDDLKTLCQENMTFRISADNCLQILQIADQINASPLKEAAMRFLNKNKSRLNKQTLTKFFKKHIELGIEWILLNSS